MARNAMEVCRWIRQGAVRFAAALFTLAVLALPAHAGSAAGGPQPAGKAELKSPESFWVILRDRADVRAVRRIPDWAQRGRAVVESLQAVSNASQAGLRARLEAKRVPHRPFWIVNAIKVTGDKALRDELAARPEVEDIRPDGAFFIPKTLPGVQQPTVNAVEWNIDRIRAWQAWGAFGSSGDGIVVANVDSGVEYTHSALVRQYRGNIGGTFDHNYSWFDPTALCGPMSNGPCDTAGHGTHTMGTMVGDDGAGNQVGVAPGARWIAAKGCEYDWCSYEALMASGQWILAPTDVNGQNPRPDLRPNVVNNSWGGGSGDPFYQGIVDAWVASGIFPAFANGNAGSYCGSSGSPGDYANSYSSGAFDYWNGIAWFSSRGPSAWGEIKPNISAPGVDVKSAYPGNSYVWMSGTSMASPHVAGTVALMWSAAPALVGQIDETRRYLDAAALDVADLSCGGTAADNNVWGEGMLDAYAAIEISPRGPTGWLQGVVQDGASAAPIAGATVQAVQFEGGASRSTTTDAAGFYSVRLPAGTFTVSVSAFGYSGASAAVDVVQDAAVVQDFALAAAPSFPVSGRVRDTDGDPVPFALVDIPNTPIKEVRTDASGYYLLPAVPQGSYQVRARGLHCALSSTVELTVDGPRQLDFTLPIKTDSYGYSCKPAPFGWIEANTVIASGWTWGAAIELPFPFPFYGELHSKGFVSATGYLTFTGSDAYWGNGPLPTYYPPNGAIYPYWDELYLDGLSSIRTEVVGQAPDRQFVIEWRDLPNSNDGWARVDFEVVLSENGWILSQYRNIDDSSPIETGGSATIGLENADGTVAFEYAYNRPLAIRDRTAVQYRLPPSAFVEGVVTDANDGLPIAGAIVRMVRDGQIAVEMQTGGDGSYRAQVRLGAYEVQASARDYLSETAKLSLDQDRQTVTQSFALRTGRAVLTGPTALQVILAVGEKRTVTFDLANTGSADLSWGVREVGGAMSSPASTLGLQRNPGFDPDARTAQGLYLGAPASAAPSAVGTVLRSWPPAGLALAWGVGYTGNVWLTDVVGGSITHEFDPLGAATGRNWSSPWAGSWAADMAYDAGRKLMCQVNVGGDNGIYCWNPETGDLVDSITGAFPWTAISQRGLAYRADDDTFYVGGWNEGILYHVKGLSHPDRGAVIGRCLPPDWYAQSISGLAWNPVFRTVWAATNSWMDTIFELDPETCSVLSSVPHPLPFYNGAGLETDEAGNLWMIAQYPNTVYLVDSGMDVPWVSVSPNYGTLPAGSSRKLALTIDTAGLAPGIYDASLMVKTNAGREPSLRITVRLMVSEYRVGVNAGGDTYVDRAGDTWMADKLYTAGSWGYMNKTARTGATRVDIAGTDDDPIYQSVRQDPVEYRFDGLPPGTYQLELRFADFVSRKAGTRLFDVIVEGAFALPAHDIVGEVGTATADDHSMKLVITDGQLNVRIVERRGYAQPIINALRVTQRPDW